MYPSLPTRSLRKLFYSQVRGRAPAAKALREFLLPRTLLSDASDSIVLERSVALAHGNARVMDM